MPANLLTVKFELGDYLYGLTGEQALPTNWSVYTAVLQERLIPSVVQKQRERGEHDQFLQRIRSDFCRRHKST